ncbi:hypothetical protein [Agrococcus sp. DT81.2]|uniref:hypothetical protein n=1 Tax=Agrococcus sp. DT81.2 TaxID=3393414 RepID=UPI003CE4A71E
MPSEASRPWAYLGLGAAALFATGSVSAVMIATDQRQAAAEAASSSTAGLQLRYASAAREIDAWEAERLQAECEVDALAAAGVRLEQRMVASLDAAAVVDDAYLIIERVDRSAFEESRIATVEAFAAGFTTDEDAAAAAAYEGVDDVQAACLAQPAPTTPPFSDEVTPAAVEELEARVAALDDPAADTARFEELDRAVTDFGAVVLRAADAVVNVNRLAATQQALATAAEPLRAQTAPAQTIDALDALTAHAQASLGRQAAIAAQPTQQPTQQPAPAAPQQQAPAPVRPQRPAPAPPATPAPPVTGEPAPSDPGGGGDGTDESLLDRFLP